jgi:uncharacterized membrane protein YuzA (DUF378 family)
MQNLKVTDWVPLVLVLIGALNWGLVGILNFDLVKAIFGEMTIMSRIIYSLVGIAAIYVGATSTKLNKE